MDKINNLFAINKFLVYRGNSISINQSHILLLSIMVLFYKVHISIIICINDRYFVIVGRTSIAE